MDDTSHNFMMIGLHKLAAERGDGLIPELLALYAARETLAENERLAVAPLDDACVKSPGNDNVIAFRPYLLGRKRR